MACEPRIFIFMYIFLTFILSLSLSFCSMISMKYIAVSIGALDIPTDARRMHREIVPRGAGVSIYFALLVSFLFSAFIRGVGLSFLSGSLLSGGALIVGLGLCDDIFSLDAKQKLFAQALICLIPVCFGIKFDGLSFCSFSFVLPLPLSFAFSFSFILVLTNAFNLIDGLDGLAVGTFILCILSLFVCKGTDTDISFLCASLLGASLGFLPYNKHKASFFLGDCGSMLLGYCASLISISALSPTSYYKTVFSDALPLATTSENSSLFLPVLSVFFIFGYPFCEFLFTIFRRLKNRKSIFSADAGHLHHRLIKRGFSHEKTVLILLAFSCVSSLLGAFLFLVFKI